MAFIVLYVGERGYGSLRGRKYGEQTGDGAPVPLEMAVDGFKFNKAPGGDDSVFVLPTTQSNIVSSNVYGRRTLGGRENRHTDNLVTICY